MMFCPDCQAALDDVPLKGPCPGCGGSRRSAAVQPQPIEVKATVLAVDTLVKKNDVRPWVEKWQDMMRWHKGMELAYEGSFGGIRAIGSDHLVNAFFCDCYHLKEWLKGDPDFDVPDSEIEEHVLGSEALMTCEAMCNSYKHHTRHYGKVTARIRTSKGSPSGAVVTIEVNWATADAHDMDALELANRCIASWREFLHTHHVTAP